MASHLVIGDPHATPEFNNDRFTLAGRFILDRRPEVVICMGDMADMNSLSSYDKGKRSFEGRRIKHDFEAVEDANTKLWAPVNEYNAMRKKNRDKQYKPRKVMLLGNHEDRITRAIECDAELEGLLSIEDLGYEKHGWEVVPYRIPILINGVSYCHHYPTGMSGNPISGQYIARTLLAKNFISSTVGHSHLLDFHLETRADNKRIAGLSAGCFCDYVPPYAKDTQRSWFVGLVYKPDVSEGEYTPEFISIKMLQERYG